MNMNRRLKIAVIGGGTAGYMAAAHITAMFPDYELHHIFSERIAPIGVGEGTIPPFVKWLHKVTSMDFTALREALYLTKKHGIQYENWGTQTLTFRHTFGRSFAYHLSAARIPHLLGRFVRAIRRNEFVESIYSDGTCATLQFSASSERFDFVINASGFPRGDATDSTELLDIIPTNAAMVCPADAMGFAWGTRSVARPHGWIFVIPLSYRDSVGYIFNSQVTEPRFVEEDLRSFLEANRSTSLASPRLISFRNFIVPRFFDGSLFSIGNAASFIEPLEATALAIVLTQIQHLSWALELKKSGLLDAVSINLINNVLSRYIRELTYFVGWHYSAGSPFGSPFWTFAKANWEKRPSAQMLAVRARFEDLAARTKRVFAGLEKYDATVLFGGFSMESISQNDQGLFGVRI